MNDDHGAVAVMTALLMVPVLMFAALVMDTGSAYLQRRQLQNAADAAALAIAQACGAGSCGNIASTASTLATANVSTGAATATAVVNGNTVTVTASAVTPFVFAPVVGIANTAVSATSAASWGSATGGRTVLPIAFSWCSFLAQTGGGLPTTTSTPLKFSKLDGSTTCTGPSGNVVPGGFGWLKVDNGSNCTVTSSVSNVLWSDPGSSSPCSDSFFTVLKGQTVLLPIFDHYGGTGSGAWYQVYSYAAFTLTDFSFQGNTNWIKGYFTKFVAPSDAFTYGSGAPDLGARVVRLTA
nr:pilus assembly protein TadG-related protein [Nakamurella panacisegetis]